ncbi:MAG: AAA family ATPase [bacterium]
MEIRDRIEKMHDDIKRVRREVAKVIVGHENIVEGVLICLLCGGHALLEGVPGLGKTLLVKSLGQILDLKYSRIQFTPDLMPADITGTNVIVTDEEGKRSFRFQEGPIFAQIILADEINRATPKTQSALLEAMQEQSVTVAGVEYKLKNPFIVLATQNPIEMEGTYPLPEAQLDRFFFKLNINYPTHQQLGEILDLTTRREITVPEKVLNADSINEMKGFVREVPIASHVKDFVIRLVEATRPDTDFSPPMVKRYVRYGSSPRGAQSLVLAGKAKALFDGRFNVSFDDVRAVAKASLGHRIILNFEGEAEGITPEDIIEEILKEVPEVVQEEAVA